MNEFYKDWIKKATEYFQTCKILIKNEHFPSSVVCFHSQQIAEKMIKAYLTKNNIEFPKTHDVVLLIDKYCIPEKQNFSAIREECLLLTDYGILPRYPGDYFEASKSGALHAFESAKKIQNFISNLL
jgi:HEPN domain-containing protein